MDPAHVDALTRSVGDGGTRRAIFRLLAGGGLGGLGTRLGLAESAVATPKGKQRKAKQQRASDAAERRFGQFQAERKRKKKRRKPVLRTPCYLTDCEERGGHCCGDGSCAAEGACCPGQKHCPGYTECFAADDCCPNAIPPLCAECDKVVCEDGRLVCRPKSTCRQCPAGSAFCGAGIGPPPWDWFDLPPGCCPLDRYFPDQWYGTGKYFCAQPDGPGSVWAQCD